MSASKSGITRFLGGLTLCMIGMVIAVITILNSSNIHARNIVAILGVAVVIELVGFSLLKYYAAALLEASAKQLSFMTAVVILLILGSVIGIGETVRGSSSAVTVTHEAKQITALSVTTWDVIATYDDGKTKTWSFIKRPEIQGTGSVVGIYERGCGYPVTITSTQHLLYLELKENVIQMTSDNKVH